MHANIYTRLYVTDAPQAYDYSYTLAVGPLEGGTPKMRVVSIRGTKFEHECQTDRYKSGMYCAAPMGRTFTTVHVTVPVVVSLDVTTFERLGGFDMDHLGESMYDEFRRMAEKMVDGREVLTFDDDERPAVIEAKWVSVDDQAITVEVK